MLIVDDHLARTILSGMRSRNWSNEIPVLPWTFHVRLLRALLDSRAYGRLSRAVKDDTLAAALAPPPDLLQVLDPRPFAVRTARLKAAHGVSILAAELLAAAIETEASIHVAEGNVGRSWPQILAGTQVTLHVYSRLELQ